MIANRQYSTSYVNYVLVFATTQILMQVAGAIQLITTFIILSTDDTVVISQGQSEKGMLLFFSRFARRISQG